MMEPKVHKTRSIGIGFITLFMLISSFRESYLSSYFKKYNMFMFIFISLLILSIVFILMVPSLKEFITKIKRNIILATTLNIANVVGWIGLWFAIQFIEPAVSTSIYYCSIPAFTLVLSKAILSGFKIKKIDIAYSGSVLLLVIVTTIITLTGLSGSQNDMNIMSLGIILSILAGLGASINLFFSKIALEKRFSNVEILASRFWLTIIAAFIAYNLQSDLLNNNDILAKDLLSLLVFSLILVVIPIYFLQLGISKCSPIIVAVVLQLAPVMTFFMQSSNKNIMFSSYSLLTTALLCAVTILYILLKQKENKMKKYVVIVDAYSTGIYLAPLFKSYGFTCLHVQSMKNVPGFLQKSYIPSDFEKSYLGVDFEEVFENLKQVKNIHYVIPGSEPGVYVADFLSEKLNLPTNGTALSEVRRNKYKMHEIIKEKGVRAMDQHLAINLDEIISFFTSRGSKEIVIKPVSSCGSEDVTFCKTVDEIEAAFTKITKKSNALGEQNTGVIVQEFLKGVEYIVNTVSADGEHYINEIWRCTKKNIPGLGAMSRVEDLRPLNCKVTKDLAEYAKSILDIIEIKHGACHFEIMYTEDGPCIIEVAARMEGGINRHSVEAAKGDSHPLLTVMSYIDPDSIIKRSKETSYTIDKHMFHIYLHSPVTGTLIQNPDTNLLKRLPSYCNSKISYKSGDSIKKTTNLLECPGYIDLVNEHYEQLQVDLSLLKHIEKEVFLVK